MKTYYVNSNPQTNGDHGVHASDCAELPSLVNCDYLGDFPDCADAVKKANQTYGKVNGCKTCCKDCHTT